LRLTLKKRVVLFELTGRVKTLIPPTIQLNRTHQQMRVSLKQEKGLKELTELTQFQTNGIDQSRQLSRPEINLIN